jgi:FkbM family methyltransferase
MTELIEQYNKHFSTPPQNVLEIGSRDGNDAYKLKEYFNISDDRVYVVEPHPKCISLIKEKYPNIKLYEHAISISNGTARFNAVITSDLGTLGMSSLASRTDNAILENWIEVSTITGKSLFELIGEEEYDLVKIDVEGHSYEVLKSMDEQIRKIKIIHLEVEHYPFWIGQKLYNEVTELLILNKFEECYRFDYNYTSEQIQSDVIWVRK